MRIFKGFKKKTSEVKILLTIKFKGNIINDVDYFVLPTGEHEHNNIKSLERLKCLLSSIIK